MVQYRGALLTVLLQDQGADEVVTVVLIPSFEDRFVAQRCCHKGLRGSLIGIGLIRALFENASEVFQCVKMSTGSEK